MPKSKFPEAAKTVRAGFLKEAYITLPHKEAKMAEQILETIQPIPAPVKRADFRKNQNQAKRTYHCRKEIVALENVEKEAGGKGFGRV